MQTLSLMLLENQFLLSLLKNELIVRIMFRIKVNTRDSHIMLIKKEICYAQNGIYVLFFVL